MAANLDIILKTVYQSKGIQQAKTELQGLERQVRIAAAGMRALGGILGGGALVTGLFKLAQGAGHLGANLITAGSDAEEAASKFEAVFGEMSTQVRRNLEAMGVALNRSSLELAHYATNFQDTFVPLGFAREEAAKMSVALSQLTVDLASFNNIAETDVFMDLQSAIVGNHETMRKYGVIITETRLNQELLNMGLKGGIQAATEQDKALARMRIIVQGSADALGDAANTSHNFANESRGLAGALSEMAAAGGQKLAQALSPFVRMATEIVRDVAPAFITVMDGIAGVLQALSRQAGGWGKNIGESLALGILQAGTAVLQAVTFLGDLISYWLKPGSPPRILPDLDTWGKQAAEVYLAGWSEANVAGLAALGGSIESVLRSQVSAGALDETALVSTILAARDAVEQATNEFEVMGRVSEGAFARIRAAGGSAGQAIAGLVRAHFDLERATRASAQAQDELTALTKRYDDALSPLQKELSDLQRQQQKLRDQERLAELARIVSSDQVSGLDKQLAMLEMQELRVREELRAREEERDVAIDAAKDKLDAAKKEEDAARAKFKAQQEALEQATAVNRLIGEEIALRERLAAEALAAEEKARRELEQAQREAEAAAQRQLEQQEQLRQAQLAYNLSVADTPGKIALLREELSRYSEDSAEHWQIRSQLAGLERQLLSEQEQAESERRRQMEQAAEKQEQLRQAELDYQLAIADTPGKLALLREELGRHTADTQEYWQIRSQIAGLERQLAAEQERMAADEQRRRESLSNAILAYNLAQADTPGKIALWRQELEGLTPEMDKYWQILTTIVDLERQWKDEIARSGQGGGLGLGQVTAEINTLYETLMGKGQPAGDAAVSLSDRVRDTLIQPSSALTQAILDFQQAARDAKTMIESWGQGSGDSLPQWLRSIIDAIKELPGAINRLLEPIENLEIAIRTAFGLPIPDEIAQRKWERVWSDMQKGADDTGEATTRVRDTTSSILNEVQRIQDEYGMTSTQAWTKYWSDIQLNQRLGFNSIETEQGYHLGRTESWWNRLIGVFTQGAGSQNEGMKQAGEGLLSNFFSGLSTYWTTTIAPWWQEKTQWIRDLWPGSEPKNPASPLRNLDEAGQALIENIRHGMDRALQGGALSLPAQAASNLRAASVGAVASTITNATTVAPGAVVINVHGGNVNSILGALRQVGLAP